MPARIPVANIYYLLCYAWDRLAEKELLDISADSEAPLADLFARVLRSGVSHLLKRGLDRSYLVAEEEIAGIRGKLLLASSVRAASFPKGRAWCAFDELSPDVLHNQIVKSTLRRLATVSGLDSAQADGLRDLYRRMPGVAEIQVRDDHFRRIALHRNNAFYGFLLDVCQIIHRNLLVDPASGAVTFRDFSRDDRQMANLFERFLLGFYRHEQSRFKVHSPQLAWHAAGAPDDLNYVPIMKTDIVLEASDRTLVIDAKYYAEMLASRFSQGRIRPNHLYQLFAYLSHVSPQMRADRVSGMLIYPQVGTTAARVRFTLWNHPVEAVTVNLGQPWQSLKSELINLIAEPAA